MARLALLLLLAGCGARYRVNEAAENVPNVFLEGVKTAGGETELSFRVEADEACEIGAGAFVLLAGGQSLAMTDVSGIEAAPGTTGIGARGSEKFTLTFDPLPDGVREFGVKGELTGIGPVAFAVKLDAENVVFCW